MPSLDRFSKPELTYEQKLEISLNKQMLTMICGAVFFAAAYALDSGETTMLKLVLSQFCFDDPLDLSEVKINDIARPFQGINPNNIFREPDNVRELSLIDPSTDFLDGECPSEIGVYNGQIFVRWTLPRIEYIMQANSVEKLAHLAFVIAEEVFHIRQVITPNTRASISLGMMLEMGAVQELRQMDSEDYDLLNQIMESDITFFYSSYIPDYVEKIQWFKSRAKADDYHKTMTPQEYINGIITLVSKYGYPEDVSESLLEDIFSFVCMNPNVGSQMLLAESLIDFVNPNIALNQIFEFVKRNPDAHKHQLLAESIRQLLLKILPKVKVDSTPENTEL